jgi:hypothetical protein
MDMDKTHRLYPASYKAGGGLSREAIEIIDWLESEAGEEVMRDRINGGRWFGSTVHEQAYFGSIKEDDTRCESRGEHDGCVETGLTHYTNDVLDDINSFGEQRLVWGTDGQLLRPPGNVRTRALRTRLRNQIRDTGDTSRSHP